MKSIFGMCCVVFCVAATAVAQQNAAGKKLIIVHTNDLQSKLLGAGPTVEYTPASTDDDHTSGGIARLATVIKNLKAQAPQQTLVFDGGDVLMGSLFHTIAREEAGEFRLLGEIGYDAITLGNHEFDFRPEGLARIIEAAQKRGGALPHLLLANVIFDAANPRDDALARQFDLGGVQPYHIFSRNGLRIGVFGLIGKDAAEVGSFARPVTFADPIKTAYVLAKMLKERERVDVVIALSHSGIRPKKGGGWTGEDVELARKVPEIDVIVSGHTHILTPQPVVIDGTPIVQAGEHGQHVGVLHLRIGETGVTVESYQVIDIDDTIPGDPAVQAEVERLQNVVSEAFLKPFGYAFDQPVVETDFDLILQQRESGLGNLVADAIRWGIDRADPKGRRLDLAVEANGQIRDDLLRGNNGMQLTSDLFRISGLGIGVIDDVPGFPLVRFYLTAPELKKALEVLTSVHPLKGPAYHLQVSGLRFRYNPNRMLFDRVVDVALETEAGEYEMLDFSESPQKLYSVGTTYYVASFIKMIGNFTYGILEIIPKNENGEPIANMAAALVDADPQQEGIQELKAWVVLMDFLGQFEDTDGNGVANLPQKYRTPEGRIVKVASWHPALLVKNATYLTWGAAGVFLLAILIFLVWPLARWRKSWRRS